MAGPFWRSKNFEFQAHPLSTSKGHWSWILNNAIFEVGVIQPKIHTAQSQNLSYIPKDTRYHQKILYKATNIHSNKTLYAIMVDKI